MVDIRSVADETKWRLAAECAVQIPVLYEKVFRPVTGDMYDKLEQEIWFQLAQVSLEIAKALQLPIRTAQETAESLRAVNSILFGPEFKGEVIEVGDDGAVLIIRKCPRLRYTLSAQASPDGTFPRCMAFTLTSEKALNRDLTARFVRAMCMGDRQCEIKIEPEKRQDIK